MKTYYVYILAAQRNGTLYVGVTSDLRRRIDEHHRAEVDSFTRKYHVHQLVYYEETESAMVAIAREKQLKNWQRDWKLALIEQNNINWRDLSEDF